MQPFEILHACKICVFPVREEVVVTAVAHLPYKTGVDVMVPSLIEQAVISEQTSTLLVSIGNVAQLMHDDKNHILDRLFGIES